MSSLARLSLIQSHLLGSFSFAPDTSLDAYRQRGKLFNEETLRYYYREIGFPYYEEFLSIYRSCPSIINRDFSAESKDQKRQLLMLQLTEIKSKLGITRQQMEDNPLRSLILGQVGLCFDMALCMKLGIHLALYIDSLESLGTEKHVGLINRANQFLDIGCFAITELGHGSNVSMITTTAHYDNKTREFVINTPDSFSTKWWIGGAALTSNKCVVFAQLFIGSNNHGVHGFVVDIRDQAMGTVKQGITIGDCGLKSENDSIDNGFIIFKNYRVPYDALLDKVSRISPDGKFHSSIKKKEKRLGKMLSSLIRGRTACISSSHANLNNALTTAIRWTAIRKQFGPNTNAEVPILDYLITRTRLMPHLANLFANVAACEIIFTRYKTVRKIMEIDFERIEGTQFHAFLSSAKALTSEWGFKGVHQCSKVLGGFGYSKLNKLGELVLKQDLNATWEGDNTILLQQAGGFVIKQALKAMQGKTVEADSIKSLDLNYEKVSKAKAPSDLLSSSSLLTVLQHLLNIFLHKSMFLLQTNSGKYEAYFDVWNFSQPTLQELGRLYGIVEIAKHWKVRYESMKNKDANAYQLVDNLFCLYCVDKILGYMVELMSEGYFSKIEAKKIQDAFEAFSFDLGESAVRIIDAVGNEDFLHGGCFGYRDGQAYKRFTDALEAHPDCYKNSFPEEFIKKLKGI